MSFQKPAADPWKKLHIAAVVAAFATVAAPTLAPVYAYFFSKKDAKLAGIDQKQISQPTLQQQ